jgi:hypothetical protein
MRSATTVDLPPDTFEALSGLHQAVAGLRACSSPDLSSEALSFLLASAFDLRNQLDSTLTGLVDLLDQAVERGRQDDDPTTSCAAWLRDGLHMTSSAAYGQVRLARQLRSLPDTAAAFAAGTLSQPHAMAITRTVDRVGLGGGDPRVAESMLLVEANGRNPHDLLMWGRHLRHRLNPQELAEEEDEQHERSWMNLNQRWDSSYEFEGVLDAEGGTVLKRAIQGILGPRARGDERSPAQRRAAGLVAVGRHCLDSGELPARGGQKPHITITATLETLRGDPGSPAAELDWGLPISGEALRRIACDAELTPILLGRNGDPLYVGRTRRTVTPRQRKALAERDRRCVWPDCPAKPDWCEGHHERLWVKGGLTNLDQLALLCGVHHRKHHRGYRLERRPGGEVVVVPPERRGPVFGPAIHAPPPAA